MANILISNRAAGAGAFLLLAAAAALPGSPAAAQSGAATCPPADAERRIAYGSCRSSSVGAGDPRDEGGHPYEDWQVRLERGQAVQIDMDSARAPAEGAEAGAPPQPVFDTYLELRRAGSGDPVASNDDRPGSLDARIRYIAAEAGDYVVRARPLASETGGDYVLRVGAPPPPPPVAALAPGRTSGSVDSSAPESETMGGFRARHYSFRGNAGDRVRLTLATPAEAATILLGDGPENMLGAAEATPGTPATLVTILPETRSYKVQANLPLGAGGAPVPFTLDFERRAAAPPRPPRAIRVGQTASGEIGFASADAPDPYNPAGRMLVETYSLPVVAGRPVTVTVESSAFDPLLEAGDVTVLGYAAALSNDDYGDGLNSRLILAPERSGTVVLRVRALGGNTGAFRLIVAPGAAPPVERTEADEPCGGHDHH